MTLSTALPFLCQVLFQMCLLISTSTYYLVYGDSQNDDNILIAFKGHNRIYLNTLSSRDYNIYDIDRNVVDDI